MSTDQISPVGPCFSVRTVTQCTLLMIVFVAFAWVLGVALSLFANQMLRSSDGTFLLVGFLSLQVGRVLDYNGCDPQNDRNREGTS